MTPDEGLSPAELHRRVSRLIERHEDTAAVRALANRAVLVHWRDGITDEVVAALRGAGEACSSRAAADAWLELAAELDARR